MSDYSPSSLLSYTMVGERPSHTAPPKSISFILLMREGAPIFRDQLFKFLSDFTFVLEVIVIERTGSLDLESYVRRFPKVRFLLMEKDQSVGEKINASMLEIATDYAFVLWSDTDVQNPFWFSSLLEDMRMRDHLCVVPELLDKDGASLPCIHIPAYYESKLKVIDLPPEEATKSSLYPQDYIGLYARASFMALGGFDREITSAFWQKMDFGMRAFQWGERISTSRKMKLKYLDTPEVESLSEEGGYDLFYLKNYWAVFTGDKVEASFWRFLRLIRPSGVRGKEIFFRYFQVKNWLLRHQYRFKKDLKGVIELWENTDFI